MFARPPPRPPRAAGRIRRPPFGRDRLVVAHDAAAIPGGAPTAQRHAVDHAVAEEPVILRGSGAIGFGPIRSSLPSSSSGIRPVTRRSGAVCSPRRVRSFRTGIDSRSSRTSGVPSSRSSSAVVSASSSDARGTGPLSAPCAHSVASPCSDAQTAPASSRVSCCGCQPASWAARTCTTSRSNVATRSHESRVVGVEQLGAEHQREYAGLRRALDVGTRTGAQPASSPETWRELAADLRSPLRAGETRAATSERSSAKLAKWRAARRARRPHAARRRAESGPRGPDRRAASSAVRIRRSRGGAWTAGYVDSVDLTVDDVKIPRL